MPYLTKSRFKLALNCAVKLYYNDKPEYANTKNDDEFLQLLAEGGFQVGALAQCYFPGGMLIERGEHQDLFQQTLQLLQQDECIIYEAAFLWQHCFIRADIVIKKGNTIELIEVKAKSFSPSKDSFTGKKGQILSGWKDYLHDIAFQTYVVKNELQENGLGKIQVKPFLMLVNKEAEATVSGLNQLFQYDKEQRKVVFTRQPQDYKLENLGKSILQKISVENEVRGIIETGIIDNKTFKEAVKLFEDAAWSGIKLNSPVGSHCKQCEFRNTDNLQEKKDGFKECWREQKNFTEKDFKKTMLWDIWDIRSSGLINQGKFFIHEVDRADLEPKTKSKSKAVPGLGMSRIDRQEIQIIKSTNGDKSIDVRKNELRQAMDQWIYPLHFIDFEGTRTALPFYENMRPYDQVAFQFSHHIVHADGRIIHQTEWINTEQGYFPNYEFIRQLKNTLNNDNGTIFKYSVYENTVLNAIRRQLVNSNEQDKEELIEFIESITYSDIHTGVRDMVDLLEIIKQYYFNPLAGGSNSIKRILPAILNSSKYLQEKYSKPVYGNNIPSKNFKNQVWVKQNEDGTIKDPYKLLQPVFENMDDEQIEEALMDTDEGVAVLNGGAAMAAYAKLQFTHIDQPEREKITGNLLRYCELDTFAMVMIWEELNQLCRQDIPIILPCL
jgi:Domain of unknown function(DUF2779)